MDGECRTCTFLHWMAFGVKARGVRPPAPSLRCFSRIWPSFTRLPEKRAEFTNRSLLTCFNSFATQKESYLTYFTIFFCTNNTNKRTIPRGSRYLQFKRRQQELELFLSLCNFDSVSSCYILALKFKYYIID